MTHDLQLIEITSEMVGVVAPLFDAYRQFYGQRPTLTALASSCPSVFSEASPSSSL